VIICSLLPRATHFLLMDLAQRPPRGNTTAAGG
jgi:hypothetical protein